jgi:hypothetical protein
VKGIKYTFVVPQIAMSSGNGKDDEMNHAGNVFWQILLSQKILTNREILTNRQI